MTHEHIDHIDGAALAGRGLPIHAPVTARIPGLAVVGLVPGQEFSAAGATIRAVGGRHALIYGSQPDCANLGYVLDVTPGDALQLPER